jgi:photosystem II stability/assembly factor-like uncharacterized protein
MNKIKFQLIILFMVTTIVQAQENWNKLAGITNDNLVSVTNNCAGTAIALGRAGTIIQSIDSGNTWHVVTSLNGWSFTKVLFNPTGRCFALGANSCGSGHSLCSKPFFSTDAGTSWQTGYLNMFDGYLQDVAFMNADTGYLIYTSRTAPVAILYCSTDSGVTWNFISGHAINGCSTERFTVNKSGDKLIIREDNYVFRWNLDNTIMTYKIDTVINLRDICYIDNQRAIAVGDAGYIFNSSDGGTSWIKFLSPTNYTLRSICTVGPDTIIVVGDHGTILLSQDGGNSWQSEDFQTSLNLSDVTIDQSGYAIAVGDSGLVLYRSLHTVPTDVQKYEVSHISNELPKLFPNYPNPFNPTTTISFLLKKPSFASLKVFDLLGREAANLVHEELASGDHSYLWNAENFSSGIYYYILQVGSYTETKKLVLLK